MTPLPEHEGADQGVGGVSWLQYDARDVLVPAPTRTQEEGGHEGRHSPQKVHHPRPGKVQGPQQLQKPVVSPHLKGVHTENKTI